MINYISKPLVNEIIVNHMLEYDDEDYNYDVISALRTVSEKINEVIPADVQPIVYAHKTINVGRRSYCSNCGKLAIMEDFCSKCGAKVKDGN